MMSMKMKTAAALVAALFSLNASADFVRAEAGIGAFNAAPGGTFEPKNGGAATDLKDAGIDTENDLYVWAYVKHPVPVIPNVRLEYLNLTHNPNGSSSFNVSELDGILYYNILDDTFFVTVDIGLDVKYVTSGSKGFDDSETLALAYARARVEPLDSLGLETLVKVTNYQDNKGYDFRIKADYTMTSLPVIQPGLEIGYRIHKVQYAIGDYINKGEYTGVYGGLMLRF
ncbi:TIGR04219 family outer membrane beta-barrel protein [Sulfurimonas sp. HSL-3221]|uniref:TIGR04219 family outer membrane beta-barrel protein n=1 Tax=Sulfurimonadaceae TaxID=2771471 RepID=UPI001E301566|nr:TIGR04219 family outer membrane beta-barrel protein [Sulfurimonas sp. HSL-3221]UFS62693.1 TIGR04219 family outer membrane beta-barrel protein [Sulfurimonas sp. HSL-3221]